MLKGAKETETKQGPAMRASVCFCMLFCAAQDFVSSAETKTVVDLLPVELGANLTLSCTYNCSSGFIRGHWKKASDAPRRHNGSRTGDLCTVSLTLSNVSTEGVKENYTCYTEDTENPQLPQKIVRSVSIFIVPKMAPTSIAAPKTETKNGIKVLASVTVMVAVVLAALAIYLCVNRNRQNCNGKGEPITSSSCSPQSKHAIFLPVKGTLSAQSEKVTLRIPQPDYESDTEVPYADIMITVRGVSTPELTQVGYLATGEWRGDTPRSALQASRSADRLNIPQPREVSRKMSSNSEYAVITYA
ncbi:uncharacterized protein [Nothobranchius furzeri]|uniref:uncharacterized protein isoform X1 n=1 Tax=Nothobranchius furzeri TaxID=105023 RepID=UPI002403E2D6|nr:uncharacterized protein LOC107380343 isoform X3 [Nothobranchius furzeri]